MQTYNARAALLTQFISEEDTAKIAQVLLGLLQSDKITKDCVNPLSTNHGDSLRLFGSVNRASSWKEVTNPVMTALNERLGGKLTSDPPIVKARSWMGEDRTVSMLICSVHWHMTEVRT